MLSRLETKSCYPTVCTAGRALSLLFAPLLLQTNLVSFCLNVLHDQSVEGQQNIQSLSVRQSAR